MGFWTSVERIVREAHVVLLIVDSRMPELSRNTRLEEAIGRLDKKMFLVFNKIDLINPEILKQLRMQYKGAYFVSGVNNIGVSDLRTALLIEWKRNKMGKERLKIGVVGYPNVGKSAIINCLARRSRTARSSVAGTTRGPQFVNVGHHLKVIDSPGVVPYSDTEVKLGVLAAKNPEKMRNPDLAALEIIKMVLEADKKILEKTYQVDLKGIEEPQDILIEIGKRKGKLKRGGIVDEIRTSIEMIRDWQRGFLRI
jgi:ribosome biogenesis GTPase A